MEAAWFIFGGIRGEHCGYLHIVLVFRECQTEG
nr:MAG TPA: Protein arginine N-methyltransferase SFM1 [Caudoviricetes sp.]